MAGSRHRWDYGGSDAREARHRDCTVCGAQGRRIGFGSVPWDTKLPDGTLVTRAVPACPGTRWVRVPVGPHPRWELVPQNETDQGHLITDFAIRTFGRRHIETVILKDLPPLPGTAWEAAELNGG